MLKLKMIQNDEKIVQILFWFCRNFCSFLKEKNSNLYVVVYLNMHYIVYREGMWYGRESLLPDTNYFMCL